MKKAKILITGASGCVGQYISSWLLDNSNADLLLWLRDPLKLSAIKASHPRVQLLIGDLRKPEVFKEELLTVTRVIHTATAWGDPERAYQVNVVAVKKLLKQLDPLVIEQIIYFSTASILDRNLLPLTEAFSYGTEYIQTKAQCLTALKEHALSEKIVAVFPTLVFGGELNKDSLFPTSYLTEGIKEACKWLWLARWFKAYSRFHFIHAKDIAFICGQLALTPFPKKSTSCERGNISQLVLAQPAISIDHAIDTLCKWRGVKKVPRLPLWGWLIEILVKILPIEINTWDRFTIKQRHFIHEPISNPEDWGGQSYAKNLREILEKSGLPDKEKSQKGVTI